MPLAAADVKFLKAKREPVYELPAGLKLHYAPYAVQQTWRQWEMGGRQEIPDIRQVMIQDEDARNDVWTWDLIVRYLTDSMNAGRNGNAGDKPDL